MSYLDDFIQKLNKIPSDATTILRKIRDYDKRVEELKLLMEAQKDQFLTSLVSQQPKKSGRQREKIDDLLKQIIKKDNLIHELSQQKIELADNLYNLVHYPTQKLNKEVNTRSKDEDNEFIEGTYKKKKFRRNKQGYLKEKWEVDPSEPCYCTCKKPAFGEMILCQNSQCNIQWYHKECLDEKINAVDKWYCKQCRKIFQRNKGPIRLKNS